MSLMPILGWLQATDPYQKASSAIAANQSFEVSGLGFSARAFWLATLSQYSDRPFCLITRTTEEGRRYLTALEAWGLTGVDLFPASELSPYEGISPDSDMLERRYAILHKLREKRCRFLILPVKALASPLLSISTWHTAQIKVSQHQAIPPQHLIQSLVRLGYAHESTVSEVGQFSRRGGILDVFPSGSEYPIRIDWFGDEIEAIRQFDPKTQRSLEPVRDAWIFPLREIVLPAQAWPSIEQSIRQSLLESVATLNRQGKLDEAGSLRQIVEREMDHLKTFRYFEGCERYFPFIHGEGANILNYLESQTCLVWDECENLWPSLATWLNQCEIEAQHLKDRGDCLQSPHPLLYDEVGLKKRLGIFTQLNLTALAPSKLFSGVEIEARNAPTISHKFDEMAQTIRQWGREPNRHVIALSAQPQRLLTILRERDCPVLYSENLPMTPGPSATWVQRGSLQQGLDYPELGLTILTDAELFGWRPRITKSAKPRHSSSGGVPIEALRDLRLGDYVIHEVHGIGQYQGIKQMEIAGQSREYLQVLYANDGKLFIPIEQMNLLTLYRGMGDGSPRLSKMGGADWDTVRSRVKRSIKDIAEELIRLYAERQSKEGYAYPPDTEWQNEMEGGFPYDETPDQLRAILESKEDMESSRPMDRLICGDVGFGKTEVAIRATFKAIMAGKQVAVLVPTTVLAQQHWDTFQERFAPYPIRVALLSRFRSGKETKQVLAGLAEGSIDLVIGTHRLISKDIEFRDLGLLVIDEEHRFGVSHKERLKQFKASIDCLMMSATPIPRTLHLALSGARDISLIATPPDNRFPVKTHLAPYNSDLIRTAILHELEREGQVYFLHNRVESIGRVLEILKEILPNVRFGIAHGQLPERELENVMLAFYNREFDVLICTTIIESGLDIPSANTIIIDHADLLGLAQLHQLRGRVGRSDVQAYCHFLYHPTKQLTDDARARLQAITELSGLGVGYQIALRDMEIRGVGNLLGGEQHGHMVSVGFDLYCQILEEAVNELRETPEKLERLPNVLIDLNIGASLPDHWISDTRQKMQYYRRLASLTTLAEWEAIASELPDRYGKLPPQAQNLLAIVRLRVLAAQVNIKAIRSDQKLLKISVNLPEKHWRYALDVSMDSSLMRWKWSSQEISASRSLTSPEDDLRLVEQLIQGINVTYQPQTV